MSIGKTVRLFLADGTPGGLLTAEIMNWTGHVISAARSDLATLLKRQETRRTGIYLLLGDDPDSPGDQLAYVGEGDDISRRLSQHAKAESTGGKDFWNRAVILTSKDMNLTKAHARYLESRFIQLAREAGRARLVNGTSPDPIALPEADISDMEYYIAQARIILPVLSVNLLRSTSAASPIEVDLAPIRQQDSPTFVIDRTSHGIRARAVEIDGEFTVRAASKVRQSWVGQSSHSYSRLHTRLVADGVIATHDGATVLTRDHVFASPSAAAAIVLGRNANGRTEWMVEGRGISYAVWQDQQLESALASGDIDLGTDD